MLYIYSNKIDEQQEHHKITMKSPFSYGFSYNVSHEITISMAFPHARRHGARQAVLDNSVSTRLERLQSQLLAPVA